MLRVRMSVLVGQTEQHRLLRHPAGRGRRPVDGRRPLRPLRRPLGRLRHRAGHRGRHRRRRVEPARRRRPAGGHGRLRRWPRPLGRPIAGRSATASSAARAGFGRSLVSALESARTVKLAAATPDVHAHLRRVDGGRVEAAVLEHRVQAVLDGVPIVMVQCGVVAAWATYFLGGWGLATALLVASAVNGFDWFGRVAGSVVTEAPGHPLVAGRHDRARRWRRPDGPARRGRPGERCGARPGAGRPRPARSASSCAALGAVHDDGTRRRHRRRPHRRGGRAGAAARPGRLGQVEPARIARGPGRPHRQHPVERRGGRRRRRPSCAPARSPTSPRCRGCCPGTFADNIRLGHDRPDRPPPIDDARLERDVADAGGPRLGRRAPRRPAVRRAGAAARARPCARGRRRAAAGRRRVERSRRRHRGRALDGAARARGDGARRHVEACGARAGRPGRRARRRRGRRRGSMGGPGSGAGATSPADGRGRSGSAAPRAHATSCGAPPRRAASRRTPPGRSRHPEAGRQLGDRPGRVGGEGLPAVAERRPPRVDRRPRPARRRR